jgi:hypothetical protein
MHQNRPYPQIMDWYRCVFEKRSSLLIEANETKVLGFRLDQGILRGKYHCTIDLLFDWFGIGCMTTDRFCFYL